uniref:Uncharacterized protein n=1 Tax=viral metagenome TaxID=1070528 RepID=A0A6M3KYD8_9ZZZZ
MREFELTIDEALSNGLSPLKVTPFNSQLLQDCLGFRLGEAGLEKFYLKENPLPSGIDVTPSWPFPQFITGEAYNFLIVRDSLINHEDIVYLVSDDHLTVTHIFSIPRLIFGQGTLMEVADFGEYAFMTNGVIMIYWDTGINSWQEMITSLTIPMMKTVCNFKGQAIGGNIVSAWYDCDETFYVWSKIGQIDFTPDRYNEAGYRRDPYGGTIYHVRRLGDNVVGYSSKGIVLMSPVTAPAATFGFTELLDIGLINQGAMDGNIQEQLFLCKDKSLYKISKEGVKIIGYESYMDQLGTSEDIIISYDHLDKDYYIGNSVKTFLLSSKGLTEVPQHPSAIWNQDEETYILPADADDYKQTIITQPFDFGYAGQKTIFEMETDLLLGDDPEVAVSYYLNPTSYSTTNYVPLNDQNIASIIAAGNAFAFHLRYEPTYDNSRLSYIKVRYKMTDLRGIRGVYAPPPRGQ